MYIYMCVFVCLGFFQQVSKIHHVFWPSDFLLEVAWKKAPKEDSTGELESLSSGLQKIQLLHPGRDRDRFFSMWSSLVKILVN